MMSLLLFYGLMCDTGCCSVYKYGSCINGVLYISMYIMGFAVPVTKMAVIDMKRARNANTAKAAADA